MRINPLARKLQLLDRLQSGAGYSVERLALELAVSRRTVFRDLRSLEDAGLQIRFDSSNSCYRLAPHFGLAPDLGLAPPKLNPDELLAILFAAHISPLNAVPELGNDLRQAMRRLLDKSSLVERNAIVAMLIACHVQYGPAEPPGDVQADQPYGGPGVLREILRAMQQQRQVRITFQDDREAEPAETTLAPQRLTVAQHGWLVEGRSSLHRKKHRFSLNLITKVEADETEHESASTQAD